MFVWTTCLLLILSELAVGQGRECDFDQFACKNGVECIDEAYRCDGEKDCKDGSDEGDCQEEYRRRCGDAQFMCDGECRPHWLKCNDNFDCEDELDEAFCEAPTTTRLPKTTTTENFSYEVHAEVSSEKMNTNSYEETDYRTERERTTEEERADEEKGETPEPSRPSGYEDEQDNIAQRLETTEEAQPQATAPDDSAQQTEEETKERQLDNTALPLEKSAFSKIHDFPATNVYYDDDDYRTERERTTEEDRAAEREAETSESSTQSRLPLHEDDQNRIAQGVETTEDAEHQATTPDEPSQQTAEDMKEDLIPQRTETTEETQYRPTAPDEQPEETPEDTNERKLDNAALLSERSAFSDIHDILPVYKAMNMTPPTALAQELMNNHEKEGVDAGTEGDVESAADLSDDSEQVTDAPVSIQTNMHFDVIEENLLQQTEVATADEDISEQFTTTEAVATKQYKESELYTDSAIKQGVETLYSLLRHTPESAIHLKSSVVPKAVIDKAKEILRNDPEALAVFIDQLGEEVPAGQDNQGKLVATQVNYTNQEGGGNWIPLRKASNVSSSPNDTVLQSALDIIYSLWEVVQESALPTSPIYPVPIETSDIRQDVVASLFKIFDDEVKRIGDLQVTSSTETYNSIPVQAENLVEDVGLPEQARDGSTPSQLNSSSTPTSDEVDLSLSSSTERETPSTPSPEDDKEDSEEDNGTDVTHSSDDLYANQDDSENEDVDARTVDDLNGQDDNALSSTERSTTPPSTDQTRPIQTSTPNPKPCLGPGPLLYAADHHFCFKNKPYHPISAYVKLYPHSDVDSLHVYLVALQLTGGDLALVRLNPVLLRKVGIEKLAEFAKIATQMSIPLIFEVDMIDMSKMHEQLIVLSQAIQKQESLILGWNFQINNKTMWITNKYGVVRNVCVNDTVNMQIIRKFKEDTKVFSHLLTVTVTEDEPDFPLNTTAKKVVRRKCDYNAEAWIDLTVEISDFQIFDPNASSAMTPVFTINKHVPLLLRSGQVPVGENHTGKRNGEYGYGGFIVNAESTVASFLMLRKFRNFIPSI